MEKEKQCINCNKTFKKPSRYGYEEWERRRFCSLSCSSKGKYNPFFNRKHNQKTKDIISKKKTGVKSPKKDGYDMLCPVCDESFYLRRTEYKEGRRCCSFKCGIQTRKVQVGKEHYNWKGGITSENHRIRTCTKYRNWRKKVFKRDNYTCQECRIKSGMGKAVILQADHIKSFAYYPDLRFDLDNGRTLCKECHFKTDTYGSKATKKQLINS